VYFQFKKGKVMAKITLTWTAATGTVASYNIYRSTSTFDSTNFKSYATVLSSVASSATEYVAQDIILADEKYFYGVSAVDSNGIEVLSEVVEVAMISAPTNLTAVFSSD
jgi:fibronectin type 3 domain-containing protein